MDVHAQITGFQEIPSILRENMLSERYRCVYYHYWVYPTNMYSNNFKFFHKYLQNISFAAISKVIQILRE
jgi:hypothetical protein